jgi:hypothetical protein
VNQYEPNFEEACYNCGSSPTVQVKFHVQPETNLCGVCFFGKPEMVDPDEWNETEADEQ